MLRFRHMLKPGFKAQSERGKMKLTDISPLEKWVNQLGYVQEQIDRIVSGFERQIQ